jgi:hypothetical protein
VHEVVLDLLHLPDVLLVNFAEQLDALGGVLLLGVADVLLVGVDPFGLRLQDGQSVVHEVADRVGTGHRVHGLASSGEGCGVPVPLPFPAARGVPDEK